MIELTINNNSFSLKYPLSDDLSDERNMAKIARACLIYKNPALFDAEVLSKVKRWAVPCWIPRFILMGEPVDLHYHTHLGYDKVPLGLIIKVQEYCISQGIPVRVTDSTGRYLRITPQERRLFDKPFVPNKILRDYQNTLVSQITAVRQAQAISMTGSGKTLLMAAAIDHFDTKTIVLCHRVLLIKQWEESIITITGKKPHKIYGGKAYKGDNESKTLIASFKSIGEPLIPEKKLLGRDRQTFDRITGLKLVPVPANESALKEKKLDLIKRCTGLDYYEGEENPILLIIDEAHVAPAYSYYSIAQSIAPSVIYGCTATPDRKDGRTMFAEAIFTTRQFKTDYEDVKDYLTPLKYISIETPGYFDDSVGKQIGTEEAIMDAEFIKILCADPVRLAMLTDLCCKLAAADKTMAIICINNLWLVDILHENLTYNNIPCAKLTGQTKADDRTSIIENTKSRQNKAIIATTTMDEGVDIPNLDAIIFPVPFTSKINSVQRAGRVARKVAGKNYGLVIDIRDKEIKKAEVAFFARRRQIVSTFGIRNYVNLNGMQLDDLINLL